MPAYAEMYRWVDENGVSHYSDRVPPQRAKQRREVLSARGHIVSVLEQEASERERAEAQAKLREAVAAEAAAARQARYDLSLTATYADVSELDSAYENRLAIVDRKISAAEKTGDSIDAALKPLVTRADAGDQDLRLGKRITQTQQRQSRQNAIIGQLKADRMQLEMRFQNDRNRYLMLTENDQSAPPLKPGSVYPAR